MFTFNSSLNETLFTAALCTHYSTIATNVIRSEGPREYNRGGILSVTCLVVKRFVMSFYFVRHALGTIRVSPPTRGDLKNTHKNIDFCLYLKK